MRPRQSKTTYTEALHDEVCVYEWTRHEVHSLNATAANVWQMCDGKTSIAEMAERLGGGPLLAEQLVELALEELRRKHLLDADRGFSDARLAVSRRALIRRGVAAALLPIVTSIVVPTPLQAQSPGAQSQTFAFTGSSQGFIVPSGVTALTVSAFGAEGLGFVHAAGGLGGSVTATLTVIPGETLVIVVGGIPVSSGPFSPYIPGFNGGGHGGSASFRHGGPGGGASDVRRGGSALGNRVVVAGGGGGAGTPDAVAAGAGGGTTGGNGGGISPQAGGTGGTQISGGAGGSGGIPEIPAANGKAGASGTGGTGGALALNQVLSAAGGGGGGGFYGGGGGAAGSSGGGGSSFADPSAVGVVHVQGTRAGAGLIILRW